MHLITRRGYGGLVVAPQPSTSSSGWAAMTAMRRSLFYARKFHDAIRSEPSGTTYRCAYARAARLQVRYLKANPLNASDRKNAQLRRL